jgi:hypothetical protein
MNRRKPGIGHFGLRMARGLPAGLAPLVRRKYQVCMVCMMTREPASIGRAGREEEDNVVSSRWHRSPDLTRVSYSPTLHGV